jgi:hypothetical protein
LTPTIDKSEKLKTSRKKMKKWTDQCLVHGNRSTLSIREDFLKGTGELLKETEKVTSRTGVSMLLKPYLQDKDSRSLLENTKLIEQMSKF